MLVGYADPDAGYSDADPDATLLNTGYADTDLCIIIMSLCCNTIHSNDTSIIHKFLTNRIADEESPQILSHTLRLATIAAL